MTSDHPEIYLIRHARPLINQKGFFSKAQAQQYLVAYNLAEVEAITEQKPDLPLHIIKKVFCSTLPRAKATAQMLFGPEVELVEDAMFREFENRVWGLPIGKFPLTWWQVTSRALWLLGLNQKEIESFTKAKARAAQAALHLAQEAERTGVAVLVAHGFLNEFIKRALRQKGWKVAVDGGRDYVSITHLMKE